MQERRQAARKIADETIQIHDINSGRLLGQVVNLTTDGLMLISPRPIESNLVFQLELVLRAAEGVKKSLQLGAESLWCSDAGEPGNFWVGFHIIDISLDAMETIENLVDSWETDDEWR